METTLRKEMADRDTRCRHCWARIWRGEAMAVDGWLVFHMQCPPRFTGFPVISHLTDEGELPDDLRERDDYYAARRGRPSLPAPSLPESR